MSHIHKSCCPPLGRWVGLGRGQLGAPRCPELAHAHQRATAMAASRSRPPGEAALSGVGLRLRVPISSSTRVTLLLIHVHVSRISHHTPGGERSTHLTGSGDGTPDPAPYPWNKVLRNSPPSSCTSTAPPSSHFMVTCPPSVLRAPATLDALPSPRRGPAVTVLRCLFLLT